MADIVILPEQTIGGFSEVGPGVMALNVPMAIPVVVGETYRVTWGADDFVCKAMDVNGQTGFGNLAIAGWGTDTQEPFLVVFSTNITTIVTNDTGITTVNVAIYQVVEADKEYLIWGSTLKEIGKAIREKTGKTDDIPPLDMPGEIRGITGGGSDVEVVYVTFMNHDGTKELHKRAVVPGNDCMEVVSGGELETPAKESTNTEVFTFAGWSTVANGGLDANALKNVTADRTVYANYITTTRLYAVRFFDGDTQAGETQYVQYGANATPPAVRKEGFQLDRWEPSYTNITADTDCYAVWTEAITFANATWAQIGEISEMGEASKYFALGDTRTIEFTYNGTVHTVEVAIADFDHDDLADGSGKAGISIVCKQVKISVKLAYNSSSVYKWPNGQTRYVLNNTILNTLDPELKAVIKQVQKPYGYWENSTGNIGESSDKIWILSYEEIGSPTLSSGTKLVADGSTKYKGFNIKNVEVVDANAGNTAWLRNGYQGLGYGCFYSYTGHTVGGMGAGGERGTLFGFCI